MFLTSPSYFFTFREFSSVFDLQLSLKTVFNLDSKMFDKQLEISVYDARSLLIKDYTLKHRWDRKLNEEVLSDNIYLPGYQNKPIKIGVYGDVAQNIPCIFIETTDLSSKVLISLLISNIKERGECKRL